MVPILGRYGQFFIYSYTVFIALGVVAAIGMTAWRARGRGLPDWFDAVLLMLLAALAGGRLGFVAGRWDYFQQRPSEVWQFSQGGLSYYGALFAALFVLWGWARWQKRPFGEYADLFAPALAILALFSWLACWLDGCAYGRETFIGPLSADLPDEYGIFAVRYRTQLAGILLTTAVLPTLLFLRNRWPAGALFWFTLGATSTTYLLITPFRADPVPQLAQIRVDTIISTMLIVVSVYLLKYTLEKVDGR